MRIYDEDIYFGRSGQSWGQTQDFYLDPGDFKLHLRKLLVQDIGDPPDIGLGRAGPDGANYNHGRPEAVTPGTNLGTIYWRGYEGHESVGGREWERRSAQVYCRYQKDGGGSLHFATSHRWDENTGRTEDGAMRDRLVVESDGSLNFQDVPTRVTASGQLQMRIKLGGRVGWLNLDLEP